jgi:hypothetical protein
MDRGLVFFCAAWIAITRSTPASAEPVGEICATAYEQAQQLRRKGELLRSRADLRLCRSTCPTALVHDCERWLTEVEQQLPSLRLSARSADGRDPGKVRVLIDGAPLLDELTFAPVDVDPGKHTLRFEDSTHRHVEVSIEVLLGQKNQAVEALFPPIEAPKKPPPSAAPSLPSPPSPPASTSGSALAFVLGGVGLSGLGTGAVLGIKGQIERSELRERCAPRCKQSQVNAIATEWLVGGIAAGAGALVLGSAVALFVTERPSKRPRAPSVSLAVAQGSAGGLWVCSLF